MFENMRMNDMLNIVLKKIKSNIKQFHTKIRKHTTHLFQFSTFFRILMPRGNENKIKQNKAANFLFLLLAREKKKPPVNLSLLPFLTKQ